MATVLLWNHFINQKCILFSAECVFVFLVTNLQGYDTRAIKLFECKRTRTHTHKQQAEEGDRPTSPCKVVKSLKNVKFKWQCHCVRTTHIHSTWWTLCNFSLSLFIYDSFSYCLFIFLCYIKCGGFCVHFCVKIIFGSKHIVLYTRLYTGLYCESVQCVWLIFFFHSTVNGHLACSVCVNTFEHRTRIYVYVYICTFYFINCMLINRYYYSKKKKKSSLCFSFNFTDDQKTHFCFVNFHVCCNLAVY